MLNKIISVLFLFTTIACAQVVGPKAAVQKKMHNFGDVTQGESVTTSFVITNSGGDLLEIKNVQATCGCTAAKPDKNQLKPGESTKLDVTFNSKGRNGYQEKQVRVSTNDPDNKEIILTIKCNVVTSKQTNLKTEAPKIDFPKTQHNFGKVNEGKVYQHTFNFTNSGKSTLKIKDVKTSCGCAVAEISAKEIKPGESASLKVELDTAKRKGRMSRSITIMSNDPDTPNKVLTLYADIEG
jgi:uncharacterized cupredoxin-like copper-binding protein